MRKLFMRQLVALALIALFVPAVQAQFQKLYYHSPLANPAGGIFKDVECLEGVGNAAKIVAVGSDSRVPANGIIAYNDMNGVPITYVMLTNPTAPGGHTVDAAALCKTPSNNLVACFFDPVDKASDIVCTTPAGVVNWIRRIPNFQVRDVVAGPGILAGERIWVTGNTTNLAAPLVVVAAFDGLGATIFYNEYGITAPLNTYSNMIGFEIDYKGPGVGTLTVVGKTSISNCYDGILVLQLTGAGAVNWVNVFRSQGCTHDWKGKALVQKPGGGGNYMIAYECKNPAVAGSVYPAIMEITAAGASVGNFNYFSSGAAFFNGNNFSVDGLDTDGISLLISGSFKNNTNFQFSGYSLNVGIALHNGLQFNEYETTGAYSPSETRLVDLDYSSTQNMYVIGGNFKMGAGVAFPVPTPFWLLKTNVAGVSLCSNSAQPALTTLLSTRTTPTAAPNARDGIGQSPLVAANVSKTPMNQCTFAKMGDADELPAELGQPTPTFAYLEGQGQILARIPADAKNQVAVTLVDLQGRLMGRMNLAAGEHRIDVSQWASGVYFVQYQGEGIAAGVQKIAVR